MVIIAVVRTAAFAVRAVYTVRYKPALAGVFLAFNNAGFGANTAALCLALGTWYASLKLHIWYCAYLMWQYRCMLPLTVSDGSVSVRYGC